MYLSNTNSNRPWHCTTSVPLTISYIGRISYNDVPGYMRINDRTQRFNISWRQRKQKTCQTDPNKKLLILTKLSELRKLLKSLSETKIQSHNSWKLLILTHPKLLKICISLSKHFSISFTHRTLQSLNLEITGKKQHKEKKVSSDQWNLVNSEEAVTNQATILFRPNSAKKREWW